MNTQQPASGSIRPRNHPARQDGVRNGETKQSRAREEADASRPLRQLISLAILVGLTIAAPVQAQPESPTDQPTPNADCKSCHECDQPTADDPCFRGCVRPSAVAISEQFKHRDGPDVVILDELEDRYLPVPFDHKGHAKMANMTRGCEVCHHFTPEGLAHPACNTCHELKPQLEDIHKPSLKGAYHRQCMSCHREWSGDTKCSVCHHEKTGATGENRATTIPSKDDLIGRMHPPIPEPDVKIYKTRIEGQPSTEVLFRHKEHINRYELACAECHHEANCTRCHQNGKDHEGHVRTLADHHRPCEVCHAEVDPKREGARCASCHYDRRQGPPRPFEHAVKDLPLMQYHGSNSCRDCHKAIPFTKLDRECGTCHKDWTQDNFDHKKVGMPLDENHNEADCIDCHAEGKFKPTPTCNECHEEEEGFNYPNRQPGKKTK